MSNIIEFGKPKNRNPPPAEHILTLNIYEDIDAQLEVYIEVDDTKTYFEIYIALMAATEKFALEHNLLEQLTEFKDETE